MKSILVIAVTVLVVFEKGQLYSQSVYVPLDHQVYPLLVKGETLGLFSSYRMRLLPLTRSEILDFLKRLDEQADKLSTGDRNLLVQMLGEFTDPVIGEPAAPESERHLYRFEEGDTQVFLDARVLQEFRVSSGRAGLEDETVSETSAFGYLRARFGDHIFVGASARSSLIRGEKNQDSRFDTEAGIPRVAVGRNAFTDQATGYLGFDYGRFRFFAGRMQLSWGSGLDERLGISPMNEPMDMLHFTVDFQNVRFSYLHANLNGIGADRYMAGHRIDVRVSEGVQLGAYETVVYARRGVRLAYLNPFVPYHFIEHQEGDRDNNMLGVDVSAVVAPGVRLLGELFIDDLNWSRPIFGYWGNKLAYQAGLHWASPFGVQPLEVRASYTRVDPWVYTHNDSLNVYTHYDASVGARIGPNADRYLFALVFQPHRDVRAEVSYQTVRRGQGDIRVTHRPVDGEDKRFLEGVVERQQRIAGSVRVQLARDFFIGGETVFNNRRDANLLAGVNAHETFFRVYLDFNY